MYVQLVVDEFDSTAVWGTYTYDDGFGEFSGKFKAEENKGKILTEGNAPRQIEYAICRLMTKEHHNIKQGYKKIFLYE